MIDFYCERTADLFLNEPLNTLSNVAFFISAYFSMRFVKIKSDPIPWVKFLIVLVVLIGFGSTAFHVTASRWGLFLDILAVVVFQLIYVALLFRMALKTSFNFAVCMMTILFAGIMVTALYQYVLNGSVPYIPGALYLIAIGIFVYKKYRDRLLLYASVAFILAIIVRTTDLEICGSFKYGTHFMWHFIVGIVLYLLVKSYAKLYWINNFKQIDEAHAEN